MVPSFDLSKTVGFEWDNGNLEHIKKHAVRVNEVYFAVNNLAYHKQTYNKR